VGDQLQTNAVFDYETQNSFSIRIRTTDDGTGNLTYEEIFTITVNDLNEAPTDISLSATNVDENQAIGTAVGTLSTSDPDPGDSHTYSLVAGAGDTDNASFLIVGDQLQTNAVFDYETQNSFSVRIRTTDDGTGNLTYEEIFTITVNDLNEAPTDISLSNNSVNEGLPVGTLVGNLTTTDQDPSDNHTYSLVAGAGDTDNASFLIVGDQLQTNAVFDYDVQNTFSIRIRTTDDGTGNLTYEEIFIINVLDGNFPPTDIDLSNNTTDENQTIGTTIGILVTTDPDAGDSHTYSLVAGAGDTDNASFQIVGDQLQTNAVFDYETQNSFSIRIRTTDDGAGNLTYEEIFTITVNDLNEAPEFTSIPITSAIENMMYSYSISTSDPDVGDVLVITSPVLPSWLNLTDNGDGTAILSGTPSSLETGNHDVVLNVSDGSDNAQQPFTITVTVNYVSPVAFDDMVQLDEDEQIVINVLDNDQNPDNEILVANIIGQPAYNGNALLTSSGEFTYTPDPDYYGYDSLYYSVCIEGTTGYCDTALVLIAINPVNDKPVAENITIEVLETGLTDVCIPVTDIDSDECILLEIIGSNNPVPYNTWNNDLLCFEYEIPSDFPAEEELECIICDNGDPMLCDTAIVILINQIEELFEITEGISPNGDGMNDTWIIHGIENYPENNVKIFNRWGNLIYEVTNYDNNEHFWDGTLNRGLNLGKKAASGTYFFILELKSINQVKTGYIVVN